MSTVEKISNRLNVELKALFDFKHLIPAEQMRIYITENINKLDDEKIALIYRFFDSTI